VKFTGFIEATGADGEELVLTTVGPVDVDDVFERVKAKVLELPPGTDVRIDLIAWND
jgi:type IV secretory pathway ATPase VirB11/archaellum biosynthesis ATPase